MTEPIDTRINPVERAAILMEALPYLRRFHNKTIVVKYGGNAMIDENLKVEVIRNIAFLHYLGIHPILVHGGGPEINQHLKKIGHESAFVGGLRVTDAITMEVVEMALAGKLNKSIAAALTLQGAKALGLSGKDANLLIAEKMDSAKGDLGFVGDIKQVNVALLDLLAEQGYIPVVCSIAMGTDGTTYNVNADHVAGHIAAAVKAEKLIVLTDVEGIFANFPDKGSLISEMNVDRAKELIASGIVDKGMIPKVEACITAIAGGVTAAHLIDGRQPHALLIEIFTDSGIGTKVFA